MQKIKWKKNKLYWHTLVFGYVQLFYGFNLNRAYILYMCNNFYQIFAGIKGDPRDRLPLEKIEHLSNLASNDNNEAENCPFSWARSPENLLRQETYLALATAFVLLRLLYLFFPFLVEVGRSTWRKHVQHFRLTTILEHPLRYLNRTQQLFSFVKDPYKGSNFQEGAINARVWASKSLASAVAIGDASTSRGVMLNASH